MKKVLLLSSLFAIFLLVASKVQASISTFTASSFARYCAEYSLICKKVDAPSASCPISGQTIETVYVHAGDGQTVYQLPDDHWTANFSNNNNSVTVSPVGEEHGISWVGVVCSVKPEPTTPPTLPPFPTTTATSVATATASATPITPTFTPTPTPTSTTTTTPEPTPTTPSCSSDQHLDASGKKCVSWELGGAPQSGGGSTSGGQVLGASTGDPNAGKVLGASTLASTGNSLESLARFSVMIGLVLSVISLYGLKKATL